MACSLLSLFEIALSLLYVLSRNARSCKVQTLSPSRRLFKIGSYSKEEVHSFFPAVLIFLLYIYYLEIYQKAAAIGIWLVRSSQFSETPHYLLHVWSQHAGSCTIWSGVDCCAALSPTMKEWLWTRESIKLLFAVLTVFYFLHAPSRCLPIKVGTRTMVGPLLSLS